MSSVPQAEILDLYNQSPPAGTSVNTTPMIDHDRLHEKHALPVYPIVIFSHDSPRRPEPDSYRLEFPGWTVLEFNYRVIQLNRFQWQDYVNQPNPVASALMSKMRMDTQERPTVKLVSLQLLSSLGLNPAQVQLISGFIDTYLRLNAQEEAVFHERLARIAPVEQQAVMEIVTSWMEQGIQRGRQEGLQQGRQQEAVSLILRQLTRRLGAVDQSLQERIQRLSLAQLEDLGEALLDFDRAADLATWLEGADEVVNDRLSRLQNKIRQDALSVIDSCESEEELDFLFPEITRIHDHDLAVLESWQNHIDWMQTLSLEERHLLSSSSITFADSVDSNQATVVLAKPSEEILYEDLKQKSHFLSLDSQLRLMMQPALRREYASYISEQAAFAGYKTLVTSNLQQASDLAVANLYWYFKVKDEAEKERNENEP